MCLSISEKLMTKKIVNLIILKFDTTKVSREEFYGAKKPMRFWYVNWDNIIISKLVESKNNSKSLSGVLR